MSDHVHDENCEHDEQVFILTDDEGNEQEMVMVYTFETDNNVYAVLIDRNDPEADGLIFRVEEENEEAFLVNIEDDAEWDKVSKVYDEIVAQEKAE